MNLTPVSNQSLPALPAATQPDGSTPRPESPRSQALQQSNDALGSPRANPQAQRPDGPETNTRRVGNFVEHSAAARARARAMAQLQSDANLFASTSAAQEAEAEPDSNSQGPAHDLTKALISKGKVHSTEEAHRHLLQLLPPMMTTAECDALLSRMTEVNDSNKGENTFVDIQTFRCFAEALMRIRPQPNPLIEAGHRTAARIGATEALQGSTDAENAVRQGMHHFQQSAGYPMTREEDIAALRQHVTQQITRQQLGASGRFPASAHNRQSALNAATQAMRDSGNAQDAVQRGLANFTLNPDYPEPHPDDIRALQNHVTQLVAMGGPPAREHDFQHALEATRHAVLSGLGVVDAVQQGEAAYRAAVGYPLTNLSELSSLQWYARTVRPETSSMHGTTT